MAHYLLWIEVFRAAGHVLCQAEDLHLFSDGCLEDLFKRVFCMAWAELARMTVMRERHAGYVLRLCSESNVNEVLGGLLGCPEIVDRGEMGRKITSAERTWDTNLLSFTLLWNVCGVVFSMARV